MTTGARGHKVPAPALAPDGATQTAVSAAPSLPELRPALELAEKIHLYDPKADPGLIESAYLLALQAHGPQRRDSGEPYITHPVAVADILAGYHLDTASIVTGLLHDVIEDTPVKLPELQKRFGGEIAGLVDGVTKLTRLELQSDRTKQAENFRKLVLAMSRDIRVLLVKLADRLHNMRTLHHVTDPDRRRRIARETMEIYAPLAERIGMDAMKNELQTLAFSQLEPEAYDTIQARLNFLRGQGADVIEEVKQELARVCEESGVHVVEVTGREKSLFSIWEKMQRRNVAFEQLSDIMAFRVVVPNKEACYAALGAVHSAYPVIAGRFKDYISTPKSNGYQSLHTGVTLREPRNQKIEVQIRTAEMHDVAENGVASHWLYKADDLKPDGKEAHQYRWVQDLLEILENAAPDELLEYTKLELYEDRVFCFTPKGELIQLPRGATPVDFAYAVHSQVGDACVGAKINGRLMPLRYQLQHGDQVEIMTARGGTPSPQWERFVVTGKARARIRRFVHQQQREQSRDAGRAELAKAFRQAGVDGSEKALEPALKALKLATTEDLAVAVGNSNLSARDVVHAAYPELRQTARAPRMIPTMPQRTTRTGTTRLDHSMPITGLVPGMAYHFAGCCHAVPGDEIVGIIATGKGVTIHARDCQTLESFAATPERFIEVGWNPATLNGAGHTARISVIASNEPSALANMTNAVAKQDGALSNLKIVNRQQDFLEVLVDVDVRDVGHLSKVIAGLRGVAGIKSVERAKG